MLPARQIAAPLGNVRVPAGGDASTPLEPAPEDGSADSVDRLVADTIKSSDWLGDHDAKPWLVRHANHAPRREFRVRPDEVAAFEGADACILCAACWSACPVTRAGRFDGPHALLKTHLRVSDPRDEVPRERLRGVADDFGAYRCHGVLACASVCPKGIDVSEAVFALRASMTHAAAIEKERAERQPSLLGPRAEPEPSDRAEPAP